MAEQPIGTRHLAGRSNSKDSEPHEARPNQGDVDATPNDDRSAAEAEPFDSAAANAETGGDRAASSHLQDASTAERGREAGYAPLLAAEQSEGFTGRWQQIQASFVDQPQEAVAQADALVADLMQRLAAGFADERERLEGQWDRGDDVSTEQLRLALTRYRSFFNRLLSA